MVFGLCWQNLLTLPMLLTKASSTTSAPVKNEWLVDDGAADHCYNNNCFIKWKKLPRHVTFTGSTKAQLTTKLGVLGGWSCNDVVTCDYLQRHLSSKGTLQLPSKGCLLHNSRLFNPNHEGWHRELASTYKVHQLHMLKIKSASPPRRTKLHQQKLSTYPCEARATAPPARNVPCST